MTPPAGPLYTVGHSNHPAEHFVTLLRDNGVEVLADVRSSPFSKYSPHFNRDSLRQALRDAGVNYVFLGDELGGRPAGDEFYDVDGHVLYNVVAEAPFFRRGIDRMTVGIRGHRVAMMCSEEDPAVCHRHLLIGRVLATRGVTLRHIRGDGRVQDDAEVRAVGRDSQPSLFADAEDQPWRSIRSVLPKSPRRSSSAS
jgi:uncharacterized protein (DUF488 family)